MHSLCATLLVGLIALQPAAPSSAAAAPQTSPAPVPLAEVPSETSCAFFDEGEMRARLLNPDLTAREQAFEELVALARRHSAIRATVVAWGRDSAALELAWTARLVIRELQKELQAVASGQSQQFVQISKQVPRPWQRDLERQLLLEQRRFLMNLGVDPDEYQISGLVRLSSEDAARLGLEVVDAPGGKRTSNAGQAAVDDVLGVVCDETLGDRVILTRVVQGSIADSIGLLAGDHLLSVAGLELRGPADIGEAMHIWNSRSESASDVLEVRARNLATGEDKLLVWIPPSAR